ncbi:hypothetical protein Tco_1167109 [Tanacetum coccineum]
MLVEDESCPVYNTDNEEEESMSVYDTDIEDVIKEEEGFVGKRGIGGEEDKIEDIIVVANDICSSMIQTTLSVDVEEDINTKSHELMSLGKSIIIKIILNGVVPKGVLNAVQNAHNASSNLQIFGQYLDIRKCKCGLDVEGKKQNTQLGHLRNNVTPLKSGSSGMVTMGCYVKVQQSRYRK